MTAFCFAVAYFILSFGGNGGHAPSGLTAMPMLHRLGNSIYFSIITATTVGYGDIIPQGFSKILAAIEGVFGFLLFGIFIAKLVSRREEIALRQIHKLSFDEFFRSTREGLYIIRKDFEHLMKQAHEQHLLEPHHWDNLTIAYREGHSILEEIPNFYDSEHDLYVIDHKRESFLLEAVQRTLHRLNQMLDDFSAHNIDWLSHRLSLQELKELIHTVRTITPLWKKRSPHQKTEAFEDILELNESMHKKIEKTI
jgi:hypothetical protein